ncbi:MAG: NAD(P)/FAD-dependent oxidoreductase, partial [Pseudomonadota bacterium]
DDPKAYLGMHVPDFPNFTMLLGPSNGLGHGGSAMFIAECQARYVCRMLQGQLEQGRATVEVTAEAHDRFVAAVDAAHDRLIWKHPGVSTYYRNDSGRVFSILPWRLVDFWSMTREVDWGDYQGAANAGI